MEMQVQDTEMSNVDLVELIHQPEWKAILLNLVKGEKMNVWSIDVSLLTVKYLEKIKELQSSSLRVPANAVLCCAILVKMKSKTIKFSSLKEEEEKPNVLSEQELLQLDEMLPDLSAVNRSRDGAVSLDELVETIESIIEKTKAKAQRQRERNESPEFELNFGEYDVEEKIDAVFDKIVKRQDSDGLVLFSQLLDEASILEMVNTFMPLLFLTSYNKITMFQEQFFGEIFVNILPETNPKINPETNFEKTENTVN